MATPGVCCGKMSCCPSILHSLRAGVVHLHAAERVGAVEAAGDKQFAWTQTVGDVSIAIMTDTESPKTRAAADSTVCGRGLTCVDGDGGPPASHVHGGYQGPGVVIGVVAFHSVQAVPRLRPSDHVHEAVQLAHCCLVPPWKHVRLMNTTFQFPPPQAATMAGAVRAVLRRTVI